MTRWNKAPGKYPAQNKYGAVKTRGYDSAHEAERARELHLLEKAGKIRDLREQVRFELVPAMWQHVDGAITRDWCLNEIFPSQGDIMAKLEAGLLPLIPVVLGERQDRKRLRRMKAKLVERPVEYRADFVYIQDGQLVVEDAKGVRTPDYIIKRKLMLWLYGIKIREV